MTEPPTEENAAAHVVANVPQLLHSRLVEEAHLRVRLREVGQIRQEQSAAVRRLEGKGFPLAGWLRKVTKKPDSPELRAAREEEKKLNKAVRRMEEIARKLGAEIETLVDIYLADTLPDYAGYRDARKRIRPWEQAIAQFQGKVGKLVDLLGQARNMASSGYDKRRKAVSATAKAQIDRSAEAAKGVSKLAETANEAARSLGQVPEINFVFQGGELASLETMGAGAMQAEFDKIIAMYEGIQKNEVEALKVAGIGEAETKRLQAASYLADYVAQIRRYTDERHVVPEEVSSVLQRLEARYLLH
jgi:hypothetical protein